MGRSIPNTQYSEARKKLKRDQSWDWLRHVLKRYSTPPAASASVTAGSVSLYSCTGRGCLNRNLVAIRPCLVTDAGEVGSVQVLVLGCAVSDHQIADFLVA
jgi:hypothetical protein